MPANRIGLGQGWSGPSAARPATLAEQNETEAAQAMGEAETLNFTLADPAVIDLIRSRPQCHRMGIHPRPQQAVARPEIARLAAPGKVDGNGAQRLCGDHGFAAITLSKKAARS